MAGDWIKARKALRNEPETRGIAALCKIDADAAVGKLIAVWGWADEVTTDGRIPYSSDAVIDEIARKRGFAHAMKEVKWLFWDGTTAIIPNFERHNGESAKKRATDANRKRKSRKRHGDSVTGNGQVSGSIPDKDVTREEKRRDRDSNSMNSSSSQNPRRTRGRAGKRSRPFKVALSAWLKHLDEHGRTPSTPTAKAQMEWLDSIGDERAIAALRHSTKQGYYGLVEPSSQEASIDVLEEFARS